LERYKPAVDKPRTTVNIPKTRSDETRRGFIGDEP